MLCSMFLLEPENGCAGSATNVNWKQTTPRNSCSSSNQLPTLSHHCGHESKRFLHIEPIEEVGCSCKGGPWLDAVAIDNTIGILKNFYGVPLGFL